MKARISIFLALLAANVFAFDAAAWQEKRDILQKEAARLQAAYALCVSKLQVPAEDVEVPVETFEDGSPKVVAHAKRAQYFLDSGLVWAEDVRIRKFKKDGAIDIQIDALHCVVDRFTKSGWAEGEATIVQGETKFRGKGVYFSSPEGYVRVFEDSEIVAKDLKFGGVAP